MLPDPNTVIRTCAESDPEVAVIVALPLPMAVNKPFELTLAVDELSVAQLTGLTKSPRLSNASNCTVSPTASVRSAGTIAIVATVGVRVI